MALNIEVDPKTFKEAINSRDLTFWHEAINDEMDSLMPNGTWALVDLPLGSKSISCKWVLEESTILIIQCILLKQDW